MRGQLIVLAMLTRISPALNPGYEIIRAIILITASSTSA